MADEQGGPKIQVDSDWKAEAQREKERLAQKEKAEKKPAPTGAVGSRPGEAGGDQLPEASFRTLMGMLTSQAIMALGGMADRETGRILVDLEGARFSIDLLDVLEQKTRGNLSDEEAKELKQLLAELRNRFVQISQLVARQMAAQASAGAGAVDAVDAAGVAGTIKPQAK